MSQPNLTEDLNVIANSNLEITMLDGDLNIIQALDDEPNDVGGLTSAELKAKFDEAGNTIKTYINETLIPEILTEEATEAARAAAEAQREANENQRIENEDARVASEKKREDAESARNVFGPYDPEAQYKVGNHATLDGSTYRCVQPCQGIPPTDEQYWSVVAAAGVSPMVETETVIVGGHTGTKITFRYGDGQVESFIVLNGDGVGDMIAGTYDPTLQAQDIFAFARGFINGSTTFSEDGNIITETFGNGDTKVTNFSADGNTITEVWTHDGVSKTKTTTFNSDGSITETVAEGGNK